MPDKHEGKHYISADEVEAARDIGARREEEGREERHGSFTRLHFPDHLRVVNGITGIGTIDHPAGDEAPPVVLVRKDLDDSPEGLPPALALSRLLAAPDDHGVGTEVLAWIDVAAARELIVVFSDFVAAHPEQLDDEGSGT